VPRLGSICQEGALPSAGDQDFADGGVFGGGVEGFAVEAVEAEGVHVGLHHELDETFEGDAGLPAKLGLGFGGVADQEFDFGGAEVAGVKFDVVLPVEADVGEGDFEKFADGVGFAGGDDVVVGLVLLEHQPHSFDVVFGVAPVAFGVEVAHVDLVLLAGEDAGEGAGDFAGDEGFAPAGGFVVEEDAVAGEEVVGFAVVDGLPVGVDFGAGVGAAGVEGGGFGLGHGLDFAKHFGGAGLVVFDVDSCAVAVVADGFE